MEEKHSRWFNTWPFSTLVGGHQQPLKGSLNHPKKVTKNCQAANLSQLFFAKQKSQQLETQPKFQMPDISIALPNFPPTSPKTSTAPLSNLQLLSFEEGGVFFTAKKMKEYEGWKRIERNNCAEKLWICLISKVFLYYCKNKIAEKVYQCNDVQTVAVWLDQNATFSLL